MAATETTLIPLPEVQQPERRAIQVTPTRGDRIFYALARASGLFVGAVLFLIGLFLLIDAWPVLTSEGLSFFTRFEWVIGAHGVAALMFWTFLIALIALITALPVSIAVALFITEYAHPKLRGPLTSCVDLLAAVPSLVFGIWGFFFLQERMVPVSTWINAHFGWIPLFDAEHSNFGSSAFIAGLVVGVMVLPICTAVIREVFSRTPPGEKEAALALGGTRWGMTRTVVLPFGRGGIIGGGMLGLGRALGETIAVAIIISPIFDISPHILEAGANSVAAHIALYFGEAAASPTERSALMAAGVVLFFVTLMTNGVASVIVSHSRSAAGVEI